MALLVDPQGLRAIHLYYGFLKWVVVQRPCICADCYRCASAMSFHRWQRVRGLNSFAGLKRRACVVAGHHFVTKGSETDVESEGRLNR